MNKAKLFTKEELKEMGAITTELIKAAIDADDKVKAKKLSDRMYTESLQMHDTYVVWLTAVLSFIGRRYGDKVLEEALRDSAIIRRQCLPAQQKLEKGTLRDAVEQLAFSLRTHLQPVKIEEDEEKFVFEMQPCGSGGRLILNGYYKPPANLLRVAKPQPMTFGQEDMPAYCAHAAINAMLAIESNGKLGFVEEPSDNLGETPCKFYVYKDVDATPEEFYTKLGKKKKSSASSKHNG